MSTMRVGHYPINSRTADHAFTIMERNGTEYRFQCYGGVWDNGRHYPAEYYEMRSMWHTRDETITANKELACHPQVALYLAQWGMLSTAMRRATRKSRMPMPTSGASC